MVSFWMWNVLEQLWRGWESSTAGRGQVRHHEGGSVLTGDVRLEEDDREFDAEFMWAMVRKKDAPARPNDVVTVKPDE